MQIKTRRDLDNWLKENAELVLRNIYKFNKQLYIFQGSFNFDRTDIGVRKIRDTSFEYEVEESYAGLLIEPNEVYPGGITLSRGLMGLFDHSGNLIMINHPRQPGDLNIETIALFTSRIERDNFSKLWKQENFERAKTEARNIIKHELEKLKDRIGKYEEWTEIIETQEYAD